MEFGERVNHIKPMHIHYSGVYNQLGAVDTVKAQYTKDVQSRSAVAASLWKPCHVSIELALSGVLAKRAACKLIPGRIKTSVNLTN